MLLICLQTNAEQLQNAVFCYTHEGNDTGELQPHQGGSETDCRRRTGTHTERPGTGSSAAEIISLFDMSCRQKEIFTGGSFNYPGKFPLLSAKFSKT